MVFNSVSILGLNSEELKILVTDTIDEVLDKIGDLFDIDLPIEIYSNVYGLDEDINLPVLRIDALPIYESDITLNIIFNESGHFIGMDMASYEDEEGIVILNMIDGNGNENNVDFTTNSICNMAQENITMIDTSENSDDIYLYRLTVESPIGDFMCVYPETSEPFTTLSLVVKEYAKGTKYTIGEKDLFLEEADSDNNIFY